MVSPKIILEQLKPIHLFKDIDEKAILNLISQSKVRDLPGDFVVLKEFELQENHCIYIVLEGEIQLNKWDENKDREYHFSTIGSGGIFGDLTFIDTSENAYTAITSTEATIISI